MMKRSILIGTALTVTAMFFTACETPEQSALAGAGTGAVAGLLLGGGKGKNAAIGGLIGGASGYAVGKYGEAERLKAEQRAGAYSQQAPPVYQSQPPPSAQIYQPSYPYGRPSGTRGYVYSPYSRGQLVDVRGIPHGAQVVDPITGQVFLNP